MSCSESMNTPIVSSDTGTDEQEKLPWGEPIYDQNEAMSILQRMIDHCVSRRRISKSPATNKVRIMEWLFEESNSPQFQPHVGNNTIREPSRPAQKKRKVYKPRQPKVRKTNEGSDPNHVVASLNDSSLTCSCGACFRGRMKNVKSNYKRHLQGLTAKFPCNLCERNYNRTDNLMQHLRKVHDNQGQRHRNDSHGSTPPEDTLQSAIHTDFSSSPA